MNTHALLRPRIVIDRCAGRIAYVGLDPIGRSEQLSSSLTMHLDETDASHSRKVAVKRPNRSLVICGNCGDQKVSKTETLSCLPRKFEPVVDTCPRLFTRKENGKSREYTP